jgi:N-acetylmuramoyl-L-alanine amidase
MKKNLTLKATAAMLAVSAAQAIASAQAINVIVPYEGQPLPPVSKNFIFGNVSPSTGTLKINGTPVSVYKTGTFLAYLPLPSDSVYKLELNTGTTTMTLLRSIKVEPPFTVDISTQPLVELPDTAQSKYLRPGDIFRASVAAQAGSTVTVTVNGLLKNMPMQPSPANSSIYTFQYALKPGDKAENAEVSFKAESKGKTAKLVSAGKLTALEDRVWRVMTSTSETIPLDTEASGYFMFLLPGTSAIADTRTGSRIRLRLNNDEYGWTDQSRLAKMEGPDNLLPLSAKLAGEIIDKVDNNSSFISIPVSETVPYGVEEKEDSISFDFYYTSEQIKWITYDPADTLVRDIRWKQLSGQTVRITVNFKQGEKLWGYDVTRQGREFRIELRHKPALKGDPANPLSGLHVIIDPGHSPKRVPPLDGAVGPTPYYEYEASLALAKVLEPTLEKLGATVTLTRKGDEHVELTDRPKIAWREKGDLFISLHFNALEDGGNPFTAKRGYTVYFYQPHSMDLGWAVHAAYQKNIPLPDEGMRYGNYEVVRQTQMPAILIENAYMMIPEQEALAMDPQFRQRWADSITEGVMSFMGAQYPKPPAPVHARKGKRHHAATAKTATAARTEQSPKQPLKAKKAAGKKQAAKAK